MEEKLIQERYNQAIKKLREMRRNKVFTDVLIQCKGGFIHAHRCVLMSTNTYFYKAFTTHLVGDNVIQIDFENVGVDVMEIIINSIYGDVPKTIRKDVEKLIEVLDTCRTLEETILYNYCKNLMMNLLDVDNCVDLWQIMTKFGEIEKEKEIMNFILRNLSSLLNRGHLMHIPAKLMANFIDFCAETSQMGDDLLPLLVEWGKKNPPERHEKLISLFGLLGKLTFTRDYTENFIQFDWFVKSSPDLLACVQSLTSNNEIKNEVNTQLMLLPNDDSISSSPRRKFETISRREEPKSLCPKIQPTIQPKNILNLQIHFHSNLDTECVDMVTQTYNIFDKSWLDMIDVKLPSVFSSNWYPMTSRMGDLFYFAISKDKTFIAFHQKSGRTHIGPAVKFQSRVTGIVDGNYMYVWNYESIVQFNCVNMCWKTLAPIRNVLAASNLLCVNGNLFFHAAFPPAIMKYDFQNNEWVVKKSFKESSTIKSIKCKCVHENCKKKLYFVANDKQLLSYDTVTNIWAGRTIPELKCSLPLIMNCDQPFILFGDSHNKYNYFLYYPVENKWSSFRNRKISWQDVRCVACDVSLAKENIQD